MPTPTDDRGKSCGLAALTGSQLGLRALGLDAYYDPHTQRELANTGNLEIAYATGGGVLGAAIWQLFWIIFPVFGMVGLCVGFLVVPVATAMITWWLTLGAVRRRRFRRLIDEVYLSNGRCPSCEYRLEGLEPEDDACVACPECGAAWRSNRVGEPAADDSW